MKWDKLSARRAAIDREAAALRDEVMLALKIPRGYLAYSAGRLNRSPAEAAGRAQVAAAMRRRLLQSGRRPSFPEIARALGYKSHATVVEALHRLTKDAAA